MTTKLIRKKFLKRNFFGQGFTKLNEINSKNGSNGIFCEGNMCESKLEKLLE